jgi:hypothetical protein
MVYPAFDASDDRNPQPATTQPATTQPRNPQPATRNHATRNPQQTFAKKADTSSNVLLVAALFSR